MELKPTQEITKQSSGGKLLTIGLTIVGTLGLVGIVLPIKSLYDKFTKKRQEEPPPPKEPCIHGDPNLD